MSPETIALRGPERPAREAEVAGVPVSRAAGGGGASSIARQTGVPARTYARIVAHASPPGLVDVDRVTGELVHVDIKKVAHIPDGGG